jgi:hypothetical protein
MREGGNQDSKAIEPKMVPMWSLNISYESEESTRDQEGGPKESTSHKSVLKRWKSKRAMAATYLIMKTTRQKEVMLPRMGGNDRRGNDQRGNTMLCAMAVKTIMSLW